MSKHCKHVITHIFKASIQQLPWYMSCVEAWSYNSRASLTSSAQWSLEADCLSKAWSSWFSSEDSFPTCRIYLHNKNNLGNKQNRKPRTDGSFCSTTSCSYHSKPVPQDIQLCIQIRIRKQILTRESFSWWFLLETTLQQMSDPTRSPGKRDYHCPKQEKEIMTRKYKKKRRSGLLKNWSIAPSIFHIYCAENIHPIPCHCSSSCPVDEHSPVPFKTMYTRLNSIQPIKLLIKYLFNRALPDMNSKFQEVQWIEVM